MVLDVRTPQEYAGGHIQGSTLMPYQALNTNLRLLPADKKQPILLYCQTGRRSALAAAILRKAGYGELYDLRGGIAAWVQSGRPVASGRKQTNSN